FLFFLLLLRGAIQHDLSPFDAQTKLQSMRKFARAEGFVFVDTAPQRATRVVQKELVSVLVAEETQLPCLQLGLLARVVEQRENALALLFDLAVAAGHR